MTIDLTNPSEWNLVFRRDLVAETNGYIQKQSFVTSARSVFVGIYVPDEPTWYRGGFLTQYIAALPSSQSDLFTALTQVANFRLTCRNYQIVELLAVAPLPSVCTIDFPYYFNQCRVEVFARDDI